MNLDPSHCFDAEIYADEAELSDSTKLGEDQRSKCFPINPTTVILSLAIVMTNVSSRDTLNSQPWEMGSTVPFHGSYR